MVAPLVPVPVVRVLYHNSILTASLIIFAKNPVAGNVKTRLAKDIGEEEALNVYKWLLHCTSSAIENLKFTRTVYFDNLPDKSDLPDFAEFQWRLQEGQDLGEKMKNAFQSEFERAEKVIIIGSDCPDITDVHLTSALDLLDHNDAVVGPASDGGYYLLGLNSLHTTLFDGISWSSDEVLELTIDKLEQSGLTFALLEELTDIDTVEDLKSKTSDVRIFK